MDVERTIDTFVEFYRDRGHHRITGSTLLPPPGDPVLFTSAGMHPLVPYLDGRPHPDGGRLVNVQRCLRTSDIDEVGDRTHLTMFEMLGSWSLGDYPGGQSLRWGHELLTDGLGFRPDRLHVTVFGGDDEVGPDDESLRTWRELGVPVEPTVEENWWSGPDGLCGPDSEIHVWTGDGPPTGTPTTEPLWVEVWNHVMMRYRRGTDGVLRPLPRSNVDTGMGLERLLTVLQGVGSVFETDVFEPWTGTVSGLWGLRDGPLRLVCDHLRSGVVMLGDGVRPSNTGRGYVLRRLLRRTLTTLWRDDGSRDLSDLPDGPLEHTVRHFHQDTGLGTVRSVLRDEQRRFGELLRRGRQVLSRFRTRHDGPLTEQDYRWLHDTHGLPRDLVTELVRE